MSIEIKTWKDQEDFEQWLQDFVNKRNSTAEELIAKAIVDDGEDGELWEWAMFYLHNQEKNKE